MKFPGILIVVIRGIHIIEVDVMHIIKFLHHIQIVLINFGLIYECLVSKTMGVYINRYINLWCKLIGTKLCIRLRFRRSRAQQIIFISNAS